MAALEDMADDAIRVLDGHAIAAAHIAGMSLGGMVAEDLARSGGYPSTRNLDLASSGGGRWQGRLREMEAPLLVIHGTADPMYPVGHGTTLAKLVPNAVFLPLEGGEHEIHPAHWDTIITAMIDHTGST